MSILYLQKIIKLHKLQIIFHLSPHSMSQTNISKRN